MIAEGRSPIRLGHSPKAPGLSAAGSTDLVEGSLSTGPEKSAGLASPTKLVVGILALDETTAQGVRDRETERDWRGPDRATGEGLDFAERPAAAGVKLTIVIPVYNEEETLGELARRLSVVCDGLDDVEWQVLYINDGSSDRSLELIRDQRRRDSRFCYIDLSRNFGHQAAVSAGLDHADGDAVVVMDADLQDPPEVIELFLERWLEGYEIVYGQRRRRKESLAKRVAYSAFYRLLRWMAKIEVPLDAGDFSLLDARVVEVLRTIPETNRFLRGLRSWVGFRDVGVEYERGGRFAGRSKYGLADLLRLALSGFVGFSAFPLRIAVWLGFAAAAVGFLVASWATIVKLAGVSTPVGWASLIAVTLFVGGVQLLVLGVIGEYLGAVYDEVRRRPVYVARSFIGIDEARPASRRWAEPGV